MTQNQPDDLTFSHTTAGGPHGPKVVFVRGANYDVETADCADVISVGVFGIGDAYVADRAGHLVFFDGDGAPDQEQAIRAEGQKVAEAIKAVNDDDNTGLKFLSGFAARGCDLLDRMRAEQEADSRAEFIAALEEAAEAINEDEENDHFLAKVSEDNDRVMLGIFYSESLRARIATDELVDFDADEIRDAEALEMGDGSPGDTEHISDQPWRIAAPVLERLGFGAVERVGQDGAYINGGDGDDRSQYSVFDGPFAEREAERQAELAEFAEREAENATDAE